MTDKEKTVSRDTIAHVLLALKQKDVFGLGTTHPDTHIEWYLIPSKCPIIPFDLLGCRQDNYIDKGVVGNTNKIAKLFAETVTNVDFVYWEESPEDYSTIIHSILLRILGEEETFIFRVKRDMHEFPIFLKASLNPELFKKHEKAIYVSDVYILEKRLQVKLRYYQERVGELQEKLRRVKELKNED